VAWSKDGRFLASGGADEVVKLWDAQNRQPEEKNSFRGHKNWITSVAFSPDGGYVVSAAVDKSVRLWELVSREAMPGSGHSREATVAVVSPDGKLVASGSEDRTVRVWEAATGKELHTLAGHADKVTALAFAPDNKTLVSAGGGEDRTIKVWDATTGKEVRTIREPGPTNDVPALIVSPDGKQIIAWVANNFIEIYDLATGNQVSSRAATDGKIASLVFSADGTVAAMGDESGAVRVVTVADLKPVEGGQFPAHAEGVADLLLTPDKKTLVTCGTKGDVKVWDLAKLAKAKGKQAEAEKTFEGAKGGLAAFAMGPAGKSFAVANMDNVVTVWDLAGKEQRAWDFGKLAAPGRNLVRALSYTADGKGLLTANGNSTLYLLDVP
jgi:WD40 repeat protein